MMCLDTSINNGDVSICMASTYRVLNPGEKFNRLTVIEHHHTDKRWRKHYLCRCNCGNEKIIQGSLLVTGNTKSCGCYGRESRKLRNFLPNDGGVINHLILQYKRHAKDRDLAYNLSRAEFESLIRRPCYYCGVPPSNNKITKNCKGFLYSGIDRVDPSKGYFLDNCVPACANCNRVKRDMTKDEFIIWIKRLCAMADQWGSL